MSKSNEAAFPNPLANGVDQDSPGLTKREMFAAMAMQAFTTKEDARSTNGWWAGRADSIASRAVECADALLVALEENTK